MEKYDKHLTNKDNEYSNNIIYSSPLDNNINYIQSYTEKNHFSSGYKSPQNKENIINKTVSFKNKKNNYPYHFQYNDSLDNSLFSYKLQKRDDISQKTNEKNKTNYDNFINRLNYNYNNKSEIIQRNNNTNLNWYENFKNSKFYKERNNNQIILEQKNKENNDEYFLCNKINEISNNFKNINISNDNNPSEPYLIKNKYAELF